jgi:hypothetical protein
MRPSPATVRVAGSGEHVIDQEVTAKPCAAYGGTRHRAGRKGYTSAPLVKRRSVNSSVSPGAGRVMAGPPIATSTIISS